MSVLFLSHPKETDLALFAGGELGPLARWRIERHLQQCGHCQEAVADFFHLQSEVSELAETPQVDWNALALEIGARVRAEAPAPQQEPRGWSAQPRVWQFGLATAAVLCAFLIVRQLPMIQNASGPMARQAEPPAPDQAKAVSERAGEAQPAAAARNEANKPGVALQFAQDASSRDERVRQANETRKETLADSFAPLGGSASEPQVEEALHARSNLTRVAVPDLEAEAAPVFERVPGQDRGVAAPAPAPGSPASAPAEAKALEKAGADRGRRVAEGLRAAPPPRAAAEADAVVLQDQLAASESRRGAASGRTQAANERAVRAELAQAPEAGAASALRELRKTTPAGRNDADAGWPSELGLSVLPAALEDPAVDVGVAADGRISFRSVDASTSTITITDVYVP